VRPIIHLDAELDHVSEDAAAGVTAYREALKTLFWRREIRLFSHDEMIAKLADASRTFHVLILKTKMKVPYTSVFLQLDCGYWSAEDEQALRSSLKKGQK
jgi:hypothetical protein